MYLNLVNEMKENSQIEVKSAEYGLPDSLWESYSSFANTKGGTIYLGVEEEKGTKKFKVVGVGNPEMVKKHFWDTINNPSKVSKNILSNNDFKEYSFDGKIVFEIHVPEARRELKPIYLKGNMGESYKRNHEGDYHCTPSEISTMLRDAHYETYDSKVLKEYTLNDLSRETISKYRNSHRYFRPEHVWGKLDDESFLVMIGAAGICDEDHKIHPTLAGMLMFSEEYRIRSILPEYFLDYQEYLEPRSKDWSYRFQSSSGEWSGNVFDFFIMVSNKLVLDLDNPFRLENMRRVDNTPMHEAVREALVNCLSNADFYGRCGVVVRKRIGSINLQNPGSIRVGMKQMLQGGVSDPRNGSILKMFNLIGYGEKAGSGFPRIADACINAGFPVPTVEENGELDRTSMTIWLRPDNSAGFGNNSAEVANNSAEVANNSAEVANNSAEVANNSAEVANNSAEVANNSAEVANNSAEVSFNLPNDNIVFHNALERLNASKRYNSTKDIITSIYSDAISDGYLLTAKTASKHDISERRTREILSLMLELGLLREDGSTKSRKYYPVEKEK